MKLKFKVEAEQSISVLKHSTLIVLATKITIQTKIFQIEMDLTKKSSVERQVKKNARDIY